MKIDWQKIWIKSVEYFFHCSSLLPMWFHYILSTLMFPILYWVVRYRRKTVRENLRASFPEKSKWELSQIERRFYGFFCDYIVETCKLVTISKKNIMRRMTFEGIEEMKKSFDNHDMGILYLGHFGNWEWISTIRLWTGEINTAQLYKPLRNAGFDSIFYKLRSRFGGENIPKDDALRRIVKYKAENKKTLIGFISDQSPKPQSIHDWVMFLNQPTPVFTGAERIAKKMNCAVYYADVTRLKRGHYHCKLVRMTDDATSMPNWQLTEEYMRLMEQSIQRQPELWLWSHKRWKHKELVPKDFKDKKIEI